jgi:hypothetical protein
MIDCDLPRIKIKLIIIWTEISYEGGNQPVNNLNAVGKGLLGLAQNTSCLVDW